LNKDIKYFGAIYCAQQGWIALRVGHYIHRLPPLAYKNIMWAHFCFQSLPCFIYGFML